ncbi:MAG: transporter, partial [Candidatus Sungbacteria bacterium]|nr:transporter [Candidatus Sungbacteria bacterium]
MMIKAFFGSKKWFFLAYGGSLLLLLLIYAQVSMSVRMNTWYGGFYDILQNISQHTFAEFRQKLIDFSWIAIPWTGFAVITNFVTRWYSLFWREAITFNYIPRWRNVQEEI